MIVTGSGGKGGEGGDVNRVRMIVTGSRVRGEK